jgi:hypothetical protein
MSHPLILDDDNLYLALAGLSDGRLWQSCDMADHSP